MQYAGIIKNDISAAPGVCVTFFTQGCPHHCLGCHNPETWDFNGGKQFTAETMEEILKAIGANGIIRNFCVMGGEPLCEENAFLTDMVIREVKKEYPNIKIYIWTGYVLEELESSHLQRIDSILTNTDVIIDGPFIQELRDITLPLRGSSNQKIIVLKNPK